MAHAVFTILVAEDEFASLEVLELLLNAAGYRVLSASNGEEALERLSKSSVDLVITDYKMPKMDGSELCQRLLADERWRELPVIFCSATYREDVPRPANVRAFFSKPLLFSELLAKVQQILQPQPGH